MQIVYSEKHALRDSYHELHNGQVIRSFECPERVEFIRKEALKAGFDNIVAPHTYGLEPVLAVHEKGYVDFLLSCWEEWQAAGHTGEALSNISPSRSLDFSYIPKNIVGKLGYYALAGDTAIDQGTATAALAGKDVTLTALEYILKGNQAAFALSRPPGHHAASDQFGGYCFLNNAAIAGGKALDAGAQKVAILDVDFHHGNGTQQIFYQRPDVFSISIHGDPFYTFPFFLGHAEERGEGAGQNYCLNYPLPPNTEYSNWKKALGDALETINSYGPDLLIVSLGVDTYKGDPISSFLLDTEHFFDYGRLIGGAKLPTLFVMEGGYAIEQIGVNVVNVLKGFQCGT